MEREERRKIYQEVTTEREEWRKTKQEAMKYVGRRETKQEVMREERRDAVTQHSIFNTDK